MDKMHDLIMDAENTSKWRNENIQRKVQGITEASARWVPWLLIPNRNVPSSSRENLRHFEAIPVIFLEIFVTIDVSCVHHYYPQTKQQSKPFKHLTSPPTK